MTRERSRRIRCSLLYDGGTPRRVAAYVSQRAPCLLPYARFRPVRKGKFSSTFLKGGGGLGATPPRSCRRPKNNTKGLGRSPRVLKGGHHVWSNRHAGKLLDLRRGLPGLWAAYSLPFWACGLLGLWQPFAAGIILAAACTGGIPVLIIVYSKILKKYKVDDYE